MMWTPGRNRLIRRVASPRLFEAFYIHDNDEEGVERPFQRLPPSVASPTTVKGSYSRNKLQRDSRTGKIIDHENAKRSPARDVCGASPSALIPFRLLCGVE
jgi:hypothetical protein